MRHDPTDLQGAQAQQNESERQRKERRAVELDDLKWLMQHERGRRIVWRILGLAGVFKSVYSPQAMEMAFREGARNLGLQLNADVGEAAGSNGFVQMIQENTGK